MLRRAPSVAMGTRNIEEDWSDQDLDLLLSLAREDLDESWRCHNAGASRAALMMLAGALEAVLLGAVVAYLGEAGEYEDLLRQAKVDRRPPSALHLRELAKVAREVGWLDQQVADEWVAEALNGLRTAAAHPGAYVRGKRNSRDRDPTFDLRDPTWYGTAFEIVARVCHGMFAQFGHSGEASKATRGGGFGQWTPP